MMFLLKTDLIIRVLVLQILMIILGQAIILIMQNISEDIIMSIITSIFQAIFQAICRIFPISETAHSAVFHDFSGRFSGACSSLTGVVHIGIAVGIVAASYKLFLKMGYEFFSTGRNIVKKQLRGNAPSQPRHFMYMTMVNSSVAVILPQTPTLSEGWAKMTWISSRLMLRRNWVTRKTMDMCKGSLMGIITV